MTKVSFKNKLLGTDFDEEFSITEERIYNLLAKL